MGNMADDTPFYLPNHTRPLRQLKPGELLFEFYVERDLQDLAR